LSQNIRVGELWLVDLVDVLGHEQGGTRPVLVLAIHSQTDLFMITRTRAVYSFSGDIA
jgi:mRNA-degrading endonuclease toxin of MazEF toxin-antitoxin module